MKIAIIGGGAAGLVSASVLKSKGYDFALFEKKERVGKKLLATGNGRCNLWNKDESLSRYHGDAEFASYALERFGNQELKAFFEKIGVPTKAEGEKIYPYSLQASSVLDMLRLSEGMSEKCDTEVLKINPRKNGFFVVTKNGEEFFDKVIVATGGKAAKNLSGGGAYNLLTDLGHKLTPLKPAIVQLKCEGTKALEGIKTDAAVKLGEREETGEVLFTAYGLSGPPVLQLSRDAKGKELSLDIVPELTYNEVLDILKRRKQISYLTLENLFTGFLNKKIGREIIKKCELGPLSKKAYDLSERDLKKLASLVKNLSFHITDTKGFEDAQVTAGGILCRDFNKKTMESKINKGLYAAGEILDVDGDCGGFNLKWAFSSALLATLSAIGEDSYD